MAIDIYKKYFPQGNDYFKIIKEFKNTVPDDLNDDEYRAEFEKYLKSKSTNQNSLLGSDGGPLALTSQQNDSGSLLGFNDSFAGTASQQNNSATGLTSLGTPLDNELNKDRDFYNQQGFDKLSIEQQQSLDSAFKSSGSADFKDWYSKLGAFELASITNSEMTDKLNSTPVKPAAYGVNDRDWQALGISDTNTRRGIYEFYKDSGAINKTPIQEWWKNLDPVQKGKLDKNFSPFDSMVNNLLGDDTPSFVNEYGTPTDVKLTTPESIAADKQLNKDLSLLGGDGPMSNLANDEQFQSDLAGFNVDTNPEDTRIPNLQRPKRWNEKTDVEKLQEFYSFEDDFLNTIKNETGSSGDKDKLRKWFYDFSDKTGSAPTTDDLKKDLLNINTGFQEGTNAAGDSLIGIGNVLGSDATRGVVNVVAGSTLLNPEMVGTGVGQIKNASSGILGDFDDGYNSATGGGNQGTTNQNNGTGLTGFGTGTPITLQNAGNNFNEPEKIEPEIPEKTEFQTALNPDQLEQVDTKINDLLGRTYEPDTSNVNDTVENYRNVEQQKIDDMFRKREQDELDYAAVTGQSISTLRNDLVSRMTADQARVALEFDQNVDKYRMQLEDRALGISQQKRAQDIAELNSLLQTKGLDADRANQVTQYVTGLKADFDRINAARQDSYDGFVNGFAAEWALNNLDFSQQWNIEMYRNATQLQAASISARAGAWGAGAQLFSTVLPFLLA